MFKFSCITVLVDDLEHGSYVNLSDKMSERISMEVEGERPRPSIGSSSERSRSTALPSTSIKSVKTFTIAAFFAVAFYLFLLSGTGNQKQKNVGQSFSRCDFPAIFNFGDSNSDTGGKSAAFHRLHLPNGNIFFQKPSGRYCDGKLIIDFIGQWMCFLFLPFH